MHRTTYRRWQDQSLFFAAYSGGSIYIPITVILSRLIRPPRSHNLWNSFSIFSLINFNHTSVNWWVASSITLVPLRVDRCLDLVELSWVDSGELERGQNGSIVVDSFRLVHKTSVPVEHVAGFLDYQGSRPDCPYPYRLVARLGRRIVEESPPMEKIPLTRVDRTAPIVETTFVHLGTVRPACEQPWAWLRWIWLAEHRYPPSRLHVLRSPLSSARKKYEVGPYNKKNLCRGTRRDMTKLFYSNVP